MTCSAPARLGCCSRAESAAGFGLAISWAPCFERWWANFCNGKFSISQIWIINDRQSPIGNIIRTDPPPILQPTDWSPGNCESVKCAAIESNCLLITTNDEEQSTECVNVGKGSKWKDQQSSDIFLTVSTYIFLCVWLWVCQWVCDCYYVIKPQIIVWAKRKRKYLSIKYNNTKYISKYNAVKIVFNQSRKVKVQTMCEFTDPPKRSRRHTLAPSVATVRSIDNAHTLTPGTLKHTCYEVELKHAKWKNERK